MSAVSKSAETYDAAEKLEAFARAITARCAIDDQFIGFLKDAAAEMKTGKRKVGGAKKK